jgi:NAD(P)-dependent dehydrogenase (short-subunit alcohol dehydrogenase family)
MAKSDRPVVLVTDVATSSGGLIARHFVTKGWSVVGIIGSGQSAKLRSKALDVQPAELTRSGDLERVVHSVMRRYGRIDSVIFNSGYALIGPVDSLTYSQMREQLSVNVLAVAELVRLVIPQMQRQGGGSLVGVANLFNSVGLPGYALYSAGQFAAYGLFESLYFELRQQKVRVKLIDAGGISQVGRYRLVSGTGRKWREQELGPQFGFMHQRPPRDNRDAKEAAKVYKAAVDQTRKFRLGRGPRILRFCQKVLPEALYHRIVERTMI